MLVSFQKVALFHFEISTEWNVAHTYFTKIEKNSGEQQWRFTTTATKVLFMQKNNLINVNII